tara:strand:+ start:356 stop:532 length:177 start_codon:yes stop_codon:yes gene_type:complete
VKYEIDEVIDAVEHVKRESKLSEQFLHHHATLITLNLMKSWGFHHIAVAGAKIKNTNK